MKNQFRNESAKGISKPLSQVENVFFAVSSIGTAICISAVLVSFVAPQTNIFSNPLLWAPFLAVSLVIASIIDFVIIKRIGRFAITEFLAWTSGAFYTPVQRKINTVLFLSIAIFGIVLSFISSYDGSSIAAGMAPTFSPANLSAVTNSERKAVNGIVSPYIAAVKAVENKITEAVKVKTSGELLRLSNGGNSWAKNEIMKIKDAAAKKYKKELQVAQSNLAKVEQREQSRADKVINHTEIATKQADTANQKRVGVIWKLLTFIGVLPLIFGVFLLVADCNNFVMMQLPKEFVTEKAKTAGNQNGPGQRSASFEGLYSNP
jgi:hypothetical protein